MGPSSFCLPAILIVKNDSAPPSAGMTLAMPQTGEKAAALTTRTARSEDTARCRNARHQTSTIALLRSGTPMSKSMAGATAPTAAAAVGTEALTGVPIGAMTETEIGSCLESITVSGSCGETKGVGRITVSLR